MLFFGHTGITLGVVEFLGAILQISSRSDQQDLEAEADDPPPAYPAEIVNPASESVVVAKPAALPTGIRLARRIDYRLVLVGSLLPDIIDRPLGTVIFGDVFSNGRIFGHTLLFAIALWMLATYLFVEHEKTWGLILAFSSAMHLLFDEMWRDPRTLLWPLYGWSFPRIEITNWPANLIHSMFTNPHAYIPEIVGAVILAQFLFSLARRRQFSLFVRRGWIE